MRSLKCLGLALCWVGVLVAPALAGFTTLGTPPGAELNHEQIFECTYGGNFVASGLNFSNGTITATRVDDNGFASNLNLLTGSAGSGDDDFWTDGIATATAQARFAGFTQEFGYRVSGFGYVKLFDVSNTGCNASGGPVSVTFGTGAVWEWARANDSDTSLSNPHYSNEASNPDGLDHMVTYQLTGLPSVPITTKVWAVFFEDTNAGSDRDHNDLMVEIRAVECVLDSDCEQDGAFCNGAEVCNADGVCESEGDPCSSPTPECCEDNNKCRAECCSNADCPSNGVFCDGVEVCVNGFCVSPGSPCSGGTPDCCEGNDTCVFECCSNAECQAPSPPCEGGELCTGGVCVAQSDATASTSCEGPDGNLCTLEHCDGTGNCVFLSNVVCQAANPPCEGGQLCNPSTGLCVNQPDAGFSTPCERGDPFGLCTTDHCNGTGTCVLLSTVTCPPSVGVCDAGSHCVPATGMCVEDTDPPYSTPCDTDKNLCTIEHCDGLGVCALLSEVECQEANPPCEGGERCDPSSGLCVEDEPDAPLSTPCEAQTPADLCLIDHCNGMGACVNFGNVMCPAADPPCEGGQYCDPADGLCKNNPDASYSTPCEAEDPPNLCTNDHCDGLGACTFLSSVPCQLAVPPCEGGQYCDPADGMCKNNPDAVLSTPCEAESPPNLCTNDHCNGLGACVFLSAVTCQPAIPPCEGGANCNPSTGMCVNKPDAVLSTPCEADSPPNLCRVDHCNGKGLCVFLRDVLCPGPVPPCEGGANCSPATGLCVDKSDAPESTPCTSDSDPCTNEHCNGSGLCVFLSGKCGACCDHEPLGGVCVDPVFPADCVGGQLEFFLNESCAAVEASGRCEQHGGACCDHSPGAGGPGPEGACTNDVLPADCVGPQLTWHKSELCADITCLETLGACCDLITGDCVGNVLASACPPGTPGTLEQHSWTKGTTCAAVEAAGGCDAEIGACCDGDPFGACTDTTYAGCQCVKCSWTKLATCATLTPPCTHNVIPTVSQWGLVVLALLLLSGAKIYFGRRQALETV